jgi:hypothetical protein
MKVHSLKQEASVPTTVKVLFGLTSAGLLGLFTGPALGLTLLATVPVMVMFLPWIAIAMWPGGHPHHRRHDYPDPRAHAHAVVDYLDRHHLAHA